MLDLNKIAISTGGVVVAAPGFKKPVSVFVKKFNSKGLKQLHDATVLGIEAAESESPRAPAQNKEFMSFMRGIWNKRKAESGSSDTVPEGEASFNDIADVFLDAYTKADLAKPVDDGEDDASRPGRTPHYKFL